MSALTDALKRLSLGDALIRRNPLFYRKARARLEALQAQGVDARRKWVDERLNKVLAAARRTRYGRGHGCGAGRGRVLEADGLDIPEATSIAEYIEA